MDSGPSKANHRLLQKTKTRVITLVVEEPGESHDLLSCHHRANGDDVHIPMGDISQAKG